MLELNPEGYTGANRARGAHTDRQNIPENLRKSKVSPLRAGKQQSMTNTQLLWYSSGFGGSGCTGTLGMKEVKLKLSVNLVNDSSNS